MMLFRVEGRILLCHSKNIPYTSREKRLLGYEWVSADPRRLEEERDVDVRVEHTQLRL
jgi:hypothetical protein